MNDRSDDFAHVQAIIRQNDILKYAQSTFQECGAIFADDQKQHV